MAQEAISEIFSQETDKVISKAMLDPQFHQLLKNDPEKAFAAFNLTESDKELLRSIRWEDEDEYEQELDSRIEKSLTLLGSLGLI